MTDPGRSKSPHGRVAGGWLWRLEQRRRCVGCVFVRLVAPSHAQNQAPAPLRGSAGRGWVARPCPRDAPFVVTIRPEWTKNRSGSVFGRARSKVWETRVYLKQKVHCCLLFPSSTRPPFPRSVWWVGFCASEDGCQSEGFEPFSDSPPPPHLGFTTIPIGHAHCFVRGLCGGDVPLCPSS